MKTMKNFLVGGLCLLACTMVYARLSNLHTDLRSQKIDSVARLYISASPYALVTPVSFQVQDAAAAMYPQESAASVIEDAMPVSTDDRLAVYLNLHNTRFENLP
jgi:hypothetical protein